MIRKKGPFLIRKPKVSGPTWNPLGPPGSALWQAGPRLGPSGAVGDRGRGGQSWWKRALFDLKKGPFLINIRHRKGPFLIRKKRSLFDLTPTRVLPFLWRRWLQQQCWVYDKLHLGLKLLMRDAGTFSSALFLPEMISGRSKSSTAMEHCPHPTTSESNSSTSPEGVVQPEAKRIECDAVVVHTTEDGRRWTIYTIGVYYTMFARVR